MMGVRTKDFPVLIVDDDLGVCSGIEEIVSHEGYAVSTVTSAQEALEMIKTQSFPLVISDIMMPGMSGIELLEQIKSISPDTVVIMMTGYSSIQGAITAIKAGAQDYLIKPLKYDDILLLLERNIQQFKRNKQSEIFRQEVMRNQTPFIVGESSGMKRVKTEIAQVASADLSVLITGESGVGKELVARAIHDLSPRTDQMFVAINCASIPSDLLESELFGHEKGAFSGASTRKYGLFEVADGGTLLLDEIGEMPLELQAKMLRAIETGVFRRLGSTRDISSNFRIISSTNKDLAEAIGNKEFRSDLFYRINQFEISVPPLRSHMSDFNLLIDHFAIKKGRKESFSNDMLETLEALKQYSWPGNVRELFNALERAFLLAGDGKVLAEHFASDIVNATKSGNEKKSFQSLAELENDHILKVYGKAGPNQTTVANILGISTRTLFTKLKKLKVIT